MEASAGAPRTAWIVHAAAGPGYANAMPLPTPQPGACALVTGASSGIGREIARCLAARGHDLALVARREERLEAVAGELAGRHGVRAEALELDLIDEQARSALPARLAELGLRVDVLVNNAGFGTGGPFHASDLNSELEQLRVLCEAPLVLTRQALPGMVSRRAGAILNVASTAALLPVPNSAGYGAAKAYALSFSEALHMEVERFGVTVTALCPGPVDTELFERNDHPVERMPGLFWSQPEEIARAGVEGLHEGRRVVVAGRALSRLGAPLLKLAPHSLQLPLLERIFR